MDQPPGDLQATFHAAQERLDLVAPAVQSSTVQALVDPSFAASGRYAYA